MATVTLLLPAPARFGAQRLPESLAARLGKADRQVFDGEPLARVFDVLPRGWPIAAVSRQLDVGDAAMSSWVRADPAYVRPDINGARLLAYGRALGLTAADTDALLPALKPLFGDAGFLIDAPRPDRWYLRLPLGAKLPVFTAPEAALGEDLFEHLPGLEADAGNEARRFRSLLSEAQVVLHNHPHNAARSAAGLAPVNSLWFWGSGRLPDHVRSPFDAIASDDEGVQSFASLAGKQAQSLPPAWAPLSEAGEGDRLFDLRHLRDLAVLDAAWCAPLLTDLAAGRLQRVSLDFGGRRFDLEHGQRWRFWRRALRALPA
ncbi:phosphoglycerate mutase [Montanilutibacter psychrotolerans]|uniref:Phosphoglycerate mutase n=1 Tax=Montanilutibacter psychrotolerans TaxID=1327343 RepID=A0A3M8T2U0_9GAMM|nr:phosphoglycerate mutase [Lysobacter psychrotolerans]RNF85440.1 phosphoglycerate mutase [Lysobacter psychrotolerans]